MRCVSIPIPISMPKPKLGHALSSVMHHSRRLVCMPCPSPVSFEPTRLSQAQSQSQSQSQGHSHQHAHAHSLQQSHAHQHSHSSSETSSESDASTRVPAPSEYSASTYDVRTLPASFGATAVPPPPASAPAPVPASRRFVAGPILPHEQLVMALSQESLVAEDEQDMKDDQVKDEPLILHATLENLPYKNSIVAVDVVDEQFIRPLSPPPDHFRRRKSHTHRISRPKSSHRESLRRIFSRETPVPTRDFQNLTFAQSQLRL